MFRDDENMNRCYRVDISEGKNVFIFEHDVSLNLFVDEFVENSLLCHSKVSLQEACKINIL